MNATFNNEEITDPVICALVVVGVLGLVGVTLPVTVPLHVALVLAGRRGFMRKVSDDRWGYYVNTDGFKKAVYKRPVL